MCAAVTLLDYLAGKMSQRGKARNKKEKKKKKKFAREQWFVFPGLIPPSHVVPSCRNEEVEASETGADIGVTGEMVWVIPLSAYLEDHRHCHPV